jgi:hypothetical protein
MKIIELFFEILIRHNHSQNAYAELARLSFAMTNFIIALLPSANQLRPKSAKTMQAMCGSKGIANFAEARALSEHSRAKDCRPWF